MILSELLDVWKGSLFVLYNAVHVWQIQKSKFKNRKMYLSKDSKGKCVPSIGTKTETKEI
jgi:hypothetical protein